MFIEKVHSEKRGFTLIELLVVVAIIGALTSIAFLAFRDSRKKAQEDKVRGDLNQIYKAMVMMSTDTGEWPGHQPVGDVYTGADDNEICQGCTIDSADASINSKLAGLKEQDDPPNRYEYWSGPYIQIIPSDPWGNEYFFDTDYPTTSGDVAAIGSYGYDRQADLDNDISVNSDNIVMIIKY